MKHHNLVMVAIWPHHAHDPMDAAIKFLTHGQGTHAAFVRENGRILENFYPRVRERSFADGEEKTVEIYTIEGITPADSSRLERWFDLQLEHPASYSVRDLFRYALDMRPIKGRSCFCSQFVARGLRLNLSHEKQPLVRLQYEDFCSPRDLRISPRLRRPWQ